MVGGEEEGGGRGGREKGEGGRGRGGGGGGEKGKGEGGGGEGEGGREGGEQYSVNSGPCPTSVQNSGLGLDEMSEKYLKLL